MKSYERQNDVREKLDGKIAKLRTELDSLEAVKSFINFLHVPCKSIRLFTICVFPIRSVNSE